MKKITLTIAKVNRIPSRGTNLAAIGGNASGPHAPKKGKGAKYTRREKHQGKES
jgi:hypothetical protein